MDGNTDHLFRQAKEYWTNYLTGNLENPSILHDFTESTKREEGTVYEPLSTVELQNLKKICAQNDLAAFTFFVSICLVFLHKATEETCIYTAIPLLNSVTVPFDNCIVVKHVFHQEDSFKTILYSVKEQIIKGYQNSIFPIKKLIQGGEDKSCIFKYFLLMDSIHDKKSMKSFSNEFTYEFIINFKIAEEQSGLELIYNQCLYTKKTVISVCHRIKYLLAQAIKNPEIKLADLKIITAKEEQEILHIFNDSGYQLSFNKSIPEVFAEIVLRYPDKMAVSHNEASMTFWQLDISSYYLMSSLVLEDVTKGSIVGIMMPSSINMLVGILAILKAGAAYLPLDPEHPQERIKYMLEDSNVGIIIATNSCYNMLKGLDFNGKIICFDDPPVEVEMEPPSACTDRDLAYILYTSGTTGNPKGVMVEHRGVVALVKDTNFIQVESSDQLLLTASLTFDLTTFEIWMALLNGLTLHILDKRTLLDSFQLGDYIKEKKITILHLIPQIFNQAAVCNDELFGYLKYFLVGGDLVRPHYINEIRKKYHNLKIIHLYGPTENTTFSTWLPVEKDYYHTIPIGKAIQHSTVYIFNQYEELQPVGLIGEICVGGARVARGYQNKEELTKQSFIKNPYVPDEIIYKTGDRGRWLPDGTIEFLGRNDNQVKIRGSRLEMSEIEFWLTNYTDIKNAILTINGAGDEKMLVAHIVSDNNIDTVAVKAYLSKNLPEYMVPSLITQIEKIPLTVNGKTDYDALSQVSVTIKTDHSLPDDEVEEGILDIWSQLLGVEKNKIGVNTDFYQLGGHSLKITILVTQIYKYFGVKLSFEQVFQNTTIRQLARCIKIAEKNKYPKIPDCDLIEYYPVSSAQKRLFILQQMDPGNLTYHMTDIYHVVGHLDKIKLQQALKKLILRHESLRTAFFWQENHVVQKIYEHVDFVVHEVDVQGDSIADMIASLIQPFSLDRPCLLRVNILLLTPKQSILVLDMHHIIADGFSCSILINDLIDLYEGIQLEPLKKTYKDYAMWQMKRKEGSSWKNQNQYWQSLLQDNLYPIELYADFSRPEIPTYQGDRVTFVIPKKLTKSITEIADKNQATLFIVLVSILFIMLHKLSQQKKLVIGTVTSGRTHPDVQEIVGMFANTLPIPMEVEKKQQFIEFLADVKKRFLQILENQDYPFEDIINDLNLARNTARNPLFDVAFVLQNQDQKELLLPELTFTKYDYNHMTSKFDLTFFAIEKNNQIEMEIEYNTSLFQQQTIEHYTVYFQSILHKIAENNSITLNDIRMDPPDYMKDKVFIGNQNKPLKRLSIQELFDQAADKNPEQIAIRYQNENLSYAELKNCSDQLAVYLLDKKIQQGSVVGILMDNSPSLIISMLGILKAGCTYLPLDIHFPLTRKQFMLDDCGCSLVLVQSDLAGEGLQQVELLNIRTIHLRSDRFHTILPQANDEDIAYIIYTSGSTGTPKGCLIQQKGLVNYVQWAMKEYFEGKNLQVPLYTSHAFDLTITSIFPPLISGNTIIAYSAGADGLHQVIQNADLDLIKVTPTHLKLLLGMDCSAAKIKKMIVGGELLSTDLANKILEKFNHDLTIYNEYGPTETVVGAMIYEYKPKKVHRSTVPIGHPIQNTLIYILDEQMKLCPFGVIGEIYIGGVGVSPGYRNRPDLTNQSFIPNPFSNSLEYLYKTGDQALYLSDGIVEYVGRNDTQIKIRGFRVEKKEIEAALHCFPGIQDVVVSLKKDMSSQDHLCAYYTAEELLLSSEIKKFIANKLPTYMIPDYYMKIDCFPLDHSGKINDQALPLATNQVSEVILPPRHDLDRELYKTWADYLGILEFGIDDNFFELGGNSFILVKMHSYLNMKFPHLKITDFFKYPTIKSLSQFIINSNYYTMINRSQIQLNFPEDFFLDQQNEVTDNKYIFHLNVDLAVRLEVRAQETNVTVYDILTAAFTLLLADLCAEEDVMLQTYSVKDQKYLSLLIPCTEKDSFGQIVQAVHKAVQTPKQEHLYSPDFIDGRFNTEGILPLIFQTCPELNLDINNTFDFAIEIGYKTTQGIAISCYQYSPLLKADKIKELFQLYAGLLYHMPNDMV